MGRPRKGLCDFICTKAMPNDRAKKTCDIPRCGSSVINLNRHYETCHPNLDAKKDNRSKDQDLLPGKSLKAGAGIAR